MGALLCIPMRKAAKPLKQCLLTGQKNALSHLSLILGVVLKKVLFHAKNTLQNENWDCDQYYLQQVSRKHLNEGLLDKLHH